MMRTNVHAYTIALVLANLTSYAMPSWAQPASPGSHRSDHRQVHFVPPQLPDTGAPIGRPKGAASRSPCGLDLPLTALVPATEKTLNEAKVTYAWGKTVAEHPTFWFYLPYPPKTLRSLEFALQDQQDNDIYRTPVALPQVPGIVNLRLPTTSAPLETGKMYRWFFKTTFQCDPQQPSNIKDHVEGWVQRIATTPTLASQLAASPQQQAVPYATNGIWYDALNSLAQLRLANPQNAALMTDWTNLLQSAGLSNMTSKPIVQCCSPENSPTAGASD